MLTQAKLMLAQAKLMLTQAKLMLTQAKLMLTQAKSMTDVDTSGTHDLCGLFSGSAYMPDSPEG